MPEQLFQNIKNKILPQWKVCFFSAILFGLAAHLYKITNWLPNWDSLVFRYDNQNMLAMGRWFLPVACAPSSFYDLPLVTGLLAILFGALGAVCICRMFGVQKKITAAMIGGLVATFPTVTSVMMYQYVADGYAMAFFFSAMAAMLLSNKKPNYVWAIILIALSSGIYQAYITVTVMLLLAYLIVELIKKETTVKESLLHSLKFLIAGAVGMGLYYLMMTLLLKLTGTSMLAYQGFDDATSLSGINIPGALYVIKHSFTDYFFDFSGGANFFSIFNCIIFGVTVLLYLWNVISNRLGIGKLLLLCVYVVFLPVGASVLAIINSNLDYHNLMRMGFLVFYLFLILQYEGFQIPCAKWQTAKVWTVLLLVAILIFQYIVIANVGYHKLNMAYEKSYGTLVRMADRIEQTDGSADCTRIVIIGNLPQSESYTVNLPPDLTGTTDGLILRADDEIVGQSVVCSALNDYCGTNYTFLYGDEKQAFLQNETVMQMGCWPEKDSVAVMDGVIVIKLSVER